MPETKGVSLKPSNAVHGAVMIDDVDVTIQQCRFRLWDYNGNIPSPILGLQVVFADEDGSPVAEQVYSAGETKFFIPSDDGRMAVPVGKLPGLNDGTNAMMFMVSLVNAGFPEAKIDDDVSVFEGTRVHVNQVPQPKRTGLKNQPAAGAENKMVLVVTKIHSYPWDKPAAGQAKAAKAPAVGPKKTASAPAVAAGYSAGAVSEKAAVPANGELHDKGVSTVVAILSAKGGTVAKSALAQEAFKLLQADPDRNALVQLVFKDEFLGAPGSPWTFDGSTLSFGG